jgi:pimeloyl-ACP methyl ester carboxylesterase
LDAVHPDGHTINLTVSRLASTDRSKKIGSLVVNPGGPGEPATDFIREIVDAGLVSDDLRAAFDLVGFDPPGVGLSSPIRCSEAAERPVALDAAPDTSAELANLVDLAKTFANGCGQFNGALLPHVGVEDVARDLDIVRGALGDDELTYLGFSYGSLIGAEYASLFPDKVRALVLDGPVDPSIDLFQLRTDQAKAFEASLDRFLDDCSARDACVFRHGGHADTEFDALMQRLEQAPIPSIRLGRSAVGPTLALEAVIHAMYARASWQLLALALEAADRGDASLLLLLSDPYRGRSPDGLYSNALDAYYAVTCLDWPAPRDVRDYTALATRLRKVAPRLGAMLAYNDLPCAYWPTPASRDPAPVRAPKAPPIVVVASTRDPATPYQWGVSLARQLTTSTLVTRNADEHTSYFFDSCVSKPVDAYLLRLTKPAKGLTCG